MASRALATNPPSRFSRTGRYPSPPPPPSTPPPPPPPPPPPQIQIETQGTTDEVSPVSPVSPISAPASPHVRPRPSFSAFDEIHLESPRELPPLGLGLTTTARPTSETFRENFNRFNNIPPGGGLGNFGGLRRDSNSSASSTSSRGSVRSGRSSVRSSGEFPEKPAAYVSTTEDKAEEVKEPAKKAAAWWHLSKWSPLMWIQLVSFFLLFHFT